LVSFSTALDWKIFRFIDISFLNYATGFSVNQIELRFICCKDKLWDYLGITNWKRRENVSRLISFRSSRRPTGNFLEGQKEKNKDADRSTAGVHTKFWIRKFPNSVQFYILGHNAGHRLTYIPNHTHITSNFWSKDVDYTDSFLIHNSALFFM
jgi:hypothetical protein